jgi:hypothetical protein
MPDRATWYAPLLFLARSSDRRRWRLNPKGEFSVCSEMSPRMAGAYRRSERRCLLTAHYRWIWVKGNRVCETRACQMRTPHERIGTQDLHEGRGIRWYNGHRMTTRTGSKEAHY